MEFGARVLQNASIRSQIRSKYALHTIKNQKELEQKCPTTEKGD
jgi:hypothetical protein